VTRFLIYDKVDQVLKAIDLGAVPAQMMKATISCFSACQAIKSGMSKNPLLGLLSLISFWAWQY